MKKTNKVFLLIMVFVISIMPMKVMAEKLKTVSIKDMGEGWYSLDNAEIMTVSNAKRILTAEEYSEADLELGGSVSDGRFYTEEGSSFQYYVEVEGSTIITTSMDSVHLTVYDIVNDKGNIDYNSDQNYKMEGQLAYLEYNNEKSEYETISVEKIGEEDPFDLNFSSEASILKGATVKIDKPGDYYVFSMLGELDTTPSVYIRVLDSGKEIGQQNSEDNTVKSNDPNKIELEVKQNTSRVLVNNEEVDFEAYLINNNNYLKLRDIAMVIRDSEKQFEIAWIEEEKAIELISNKEYTIVGGELTQGDGSTKKAILNKNSKIYLDSELIELNAYLINSNNYFKLRDITKLFNIGTDWDEESKTVILDTSKDYIE